MISKRVLLIAAALLVVSASSTMAAVVNADDFNVATLNIGATDALNLQSAASYGIVSGTVLTPVPTEYSTVRGYVVNGCASLAWNGVGGINSSAAATDPDGIRAIGIMSGQEAMDYVGMTTFKGHTITAADSLMAVVKYGDANFDGIIDGTDYGFIDYGYANGGTGWVLGDFTYDGLIDGTDYGYIDYVYANFPVAAAAAAVPEPSTVILLVSSALCALFVYFRKR